MQKGLIKLLIKTKIMDKEQIFGLIRHALTIIGGALVAKGYIGDELSEEIIGVVISTAGIIWSFIAKKKK